MRVSLLDGENGSILVDWTSIDDNEGVVLLEYHELKPAHKYIIKYEFFDKLLSEGNEVTENQYSATYTNCKLPFVIQELLI
jgi:hypothetical protein